MYVDYIDQWFLTCGPRPPGGPRHKKKNFLSKILNQYSSVAFMISYLTIQNFNYTKKLVQLN